MASRPPLRPAASGVVAVEDVLRAANRAAVDWSARPALERGRALLDAAAELEARRGGLVQELRGNGMRLSEAVEDVEAAIDETVRWAGWADKLDAVLPRLHQLPPAGSGTVVAVLGAHEEPVRAAAVAAVPVLAVGGAVLLLPRPGTEGPVALLAMALGSALPVGLLGDHPDWDDPDGAAELGSAAGAVGATLDLRHAAPDEAGPGLTALRTAVVAAGGRIVPPTAERPARSGDDPVAALGTVLL